MRFIAAADETESGDRQGPFVYGGFVAPLRDWKEWFAPAWSERVLGAPPPIPYLHMTDIRSATWRTNHRLTGYEAENRIEEAVRVIGSMGSLYAVSTLINSGHFREVFNTMRVVKAGLQPGVHLFEPDYIGFLGFVLGALDHIGREYPAAERVDFVVERKSGITQNIPAFFNGVAESLRLIGRAELTPLIGSLEPGGKECVMLQAADVFLWHMRRFESGGDGVDERRLRTMIDGKTSSRMPFKPADAEGMRARADATPPVNPFRK